MPSRGKWATPALKYEACISKGHTYGNLILCPSSFFSLYSALSIQAKFDSPEGLYVSNIIEESIIDHIFQLFFSSARFFHVLINLLFGSLLYLNMRCNGCSIGDKAEKDNRYHCCWTVKQGQKKWH